MKYIFVAGAPGSKWSGVAKNIYYSPSVDSTDFHVDRTYYKDGKELMHLGSYFDPGMDNHLPELMGTLSRFELEGIFNKPFTGTAGTGVRIIKSHIFCNNIDVIKQNWPDCPIVLVYRPDDACLGWWVKSGHFDIRYPDYKPYYQNFQVMAEKISEQNQGLLRAMSKYPQFQVANNIQLCDWLKIQWPPTTFRQDYAESDVKVTVI